MKNLYLLDFDGTLTFKDSSKYFFKILLGKQFYYLYYLHNIFTILLYLLKLKNQFDLKKKRYKLLLNNTKYDKLCSVVYESDVLIDKIIRPEAREFLKKIKNKNNKVIIVSAGLSIFLEKWANKNSFDLLTNNVFVNKEKKFEFVYSYDCNSYGKVKRINEYIDINSFEKIYAYGDSVGDLEMLKLADKSYYKPFK